MDSWGIAWVALAAIVWAICWLGVRVYEADKRHDTTGDAEAWKYHDRRGKGS